jgi:ABC-type nitrate/sulfonate/bicarbonate transport system permease component
LVFHSMRLTCAQTWSGTVAVELLEILRGVGFLANPAILQRISANL